MKTRVLPICWLVVWLACLGWCRVMAVPVAIGDASFEGNAIGAGAWTNDLSPEWQESNGANNAAGFEEYIAGFAAEGTDHLGMELNHDVWQDLGVTYQANTRYTLTVAVGNRNGVTQGGNDSQYVLASPSGAEYGAGSFNASVLAAQTFGNAPALVFDTPSNPSAVGQVIRVLLRARGSGRSHFDNIRLDAVSLALPGGAVVGGLDTGEVTSGGAVLGGVVTDIGNAAPVVTMYWGTINGGTNASMWQNKRVLAGTQAGAFSTEVSGLSAATTWYFTASASNSAGVTWAVPSASFETLPNPPVVVTGVASGVTASSAVLAAEVTSTGGQNPAVTMYYGRVDGGVDAGAWEGSRLLGSGSGAVSGVVSGLEPATVYYFRAFARNSGGESWGGVSGSFATKAVRLPVISNRDPEGVTGTTVNLRGEVEDTGDDPPVVTLFYGPVDGGTVAGAWAVAVGAGVQEGEFTRFVSGLSPSTAYFFRWRAVNAAGTVWSGESGSFTTTALVPSGVVIHEFHYNPGDNTSLEEFVELHNPGDTVVDLSGWSLSDAVSYVFPAGTQLAAGGYMVVAENPAVLQSKYGISGVRGPWTGKLSSEGERIDLRDAGGVLRDRVGYSAGFPWPTAADGAGPSAELIHPSLDNDLGGSWRASGGMSAPLVTYVPALAGGWRYFKGTAEASSPVTAWRGVSFDDASWLSGQAGIGYGDDGVNTNLGDMRRRFLVSGYASVYLRKTFTVPAGSIPRQLRLRMRYDDGCVVWINGVEVTRKNVAAGQLAYNYLAPGNHDSDLWEEVIIDNADMFLFGGTNVLAVHGFNTATNSGDFYVDMELSSGGGGSPLPTPGRANGVNRPLPLIPPAIRQVAHTPQSPGPGQDVLVTARITDPDGMGAVSLSYQLVDPGAYIRITDAAYQTSWTTVPMRDDGTSGDLLAGDSTYTAVLPSALQTHRRLVRYRVTFADALGNTQMVPYADDEQPNFAYFVYGGVPSWTGAMRPSSFNGYPATGRQTYPAALLESMPPLHLLATSADVANCQYNSSYSATRFRGTVVQRGVVHDHIEFRVRGIGSTYQSGKNKWNLYFNRSRDYQGYDNTGRPYKQKWNNLLVNANASPWASVHRGSGGVEEAVSNRVYQLAGMPAMNTHFFHFRVIDEALEASPTDQYTGDLWGLYLGLEPTEGGFLEERGLPDGNIYSIEGGGGDKKHQAPGQPVDSSDWNAFNNGVAQTGQTEHWYRDNVDLPALYTFLALNRLIGNVDVRPGDNYRFYHRSTDNRWVIIPYDMDMQFIAAHHWGGSMDGMVVAGAPSVVRALYRHPALAREYRNRCRELLSLMASDGGASGGQIGQLVDETAGFINPPGVELTWADLDAAMWNLHPRTAGSGANTGQSSHRGNFFRAYYLDGGRGGLGGTVSTSSWVRTLADSNADGFSDHEGLMQWFTNYATNTWPGGTWSRKAVNGMGSGVDSDANRQRGYGYKYLEFEALYGGWIDSNNNPTGLPQMDFPNKPVVSRAGTGFGVDRLAFLSGGFSDPQGAATYAAHEWRLAEIRAPGVPGYVAGEPRRYEIEPVWTSGELSGAPGLMTIPFGVAEPGRTYRVRVRHKDSTGNWSYWSDPVQFVAEEAAPAELVHYWNFNMPAALLVPAFSKGGALMEVVLGSTATYEAGTGQEFAGLNARNGDVPGSHLRVNNPLAAGTEVRVAVPTTGYEEIVVRYEVRRSGQGPGYQQVFYTLDGETYVPFAGFAVEDAAPVVKVLDFRGVAGVAGNPDFGLRVTFAQGGGGLAGNLRIDNLTVEGLALPGGDPRFIPGGDGGWNLAANWESGIVPDGVGALAVLGPPERDRTVELTESVVLGTLRIDHQGGAFGNRLAGGVGVGLAFAGEAADAVIAVEGDGMGLTELALAGGVELRGDLVLQVDHVGGDVRDGALVLGGSWSGPGGMRKAGHGMVSLTGSGNVFAGAVQVEQGVLRVLQSAVPSAVNDVQVRAGGQLRLASGGGEVQRHAFGGVLRLAGTGRSGDFADAVGAGVAGALRYQPESTGGNRAEVVGPVVLDGDAVVHVEGAGNALVLAGGIAGNAALSVSGEGMLVLAGDGRGMTGIVRVGTGVLEVNSGYALASVEVSAAGILRGAGAVGPVTGDGLVAPGREVLRAASAAATSYAFEFARDGGTGNGMLDLTGGSGFARLPGKVDLYIHLVGMGVGNRLQGGFLAEAAVDLEGAMAAAGVNLWVEDRAGGVVHGGLRYRQATVADAVEWAVVTRTVDLGAGLVGVKTVEVRVGGTPATYAQWRNLHFADPADRDDPAVSGPLANPAGDGVNNLLRYAHGLGPHDRWEGLMPVMASSPLGSHRFRFRYDAAKTDLVWRVVGTSDPGNWGVVAFDSSVDPAPETVDGWSEVALPASLSGGAAVDSAQFWRLEVRLPEG